MVYSIYGSLDKFRVGCVYRLPASIVTDRPLLLAPQSIPLDRCSELIVDRMMLDGNAQINLEDSAVVSYMREIVKLMQPKTAEKAASFVLTIRCDMTPKEFKAMLGKYLKPNHKP